MVNRAGRTGGTFLHTSRTNPSRVNKDNVPDHLKEKYTEEVNDLTEDVLTNLDFLGIDTLIPIGGDDTLGVADRLHADHNLPMIGVWIKLLTVPYRLLYPAIILFCCVGIYSVQNSAFDVLLTAIFGVFGYVCEIGRAHV